MKVELVPYQPAYGEAVAAAMRQADRDEVSAFDGSSPLQAIEHSVAKSDQVIVILFDGEPVAVGGFGMVSLLTSTYAGWLLGTDALVTHYKAFSRLSREWMRGGVPTEVKRLINAVDDRNTLSKRWLKWLGFDLGEPQPMGIQGLPFRVLTWENPSCAG